MTREEAEHVFEPFWTASSARSLNPFSHGFGLYVCKQICQSLDGDITVESKLQVGSKFTFTMAVFPPEGTTDEGNQISAINGSNELLTDQHDNSGGRESDERQLPAHKMGASKLFLEDILAPDEPVVATTDVVRFQGLTFDLNASRSMPTDLPGIESQSTIQKNELKRFLGFLETMQNHGLFQEDRAASGRVVYADN